MSDCTACLPQPRTFPLTPAPDSSGATTTRTESYSARSCTGYVEATESCELALQVAYKGAGHWVQAGAWCRAVVPHTALPAKFKCQPRLLPCPACHPTPNPYLIIADLAVEGHIGLVLGEQLHQGLWGLIGAHHMQDSPLQDSSWQHCPHKRDHLPNQHLHRLPAGHKELGCVA